MKITRRVEIEKGYRVVMGWQGRSVKARVERDGQPFTAYKLFATEYGAVNYWFGQYYHGKVTLPSLPMLQSFFDLTLTLFYQIEDLLPPNDPRRVAIVGLNSWAWHEMMPPDLR